MSSLEDKTIQYKNEIKSNFKRYNDNKKDFIKTKKFNDFMNISNFTRKNKFIYDSIQSLLSSKKEVKDENISPEEYISFIEKQLNNDNNEVGLHNIFNVFCDIKTKEISWNKFPLIAKELGNEELANNLMKVIKQSDLYSKELNYEQFLEIMNSDSGDEKEEIKSNSNDIKNKNEFFINNNKNEEKIIKINDYIDDYEEKPTYKQRKMMNNKNKEYEEEIISSSKSINKTSKNFDIEENSYDNKKHNNENYNVNEKIIKKYHRRYRSKKIPSYNNENTNTENININNKPINKYRKKHSFN